MRILLNRLNSFQILVTFYLMLAAISSVILWLPFLHNEGIKITFIDAVFTAVSAISVTGLSVINIHEVFNPFGILALLVMLQVGGVGIMTMGTFIWIFMGKKIGLKERQWIAIDQNLSTLAGLVQLMKNILLLSLIIEGIGTLLLMICFMFQGYYETWYESFYYALFAAVSAYTNAGFDIFGDSLFGFAHDYFVQSVNIVLIIFGAIGFPVLLECIQYLNSKRLKKRYQFSLFTKITTLSFFSLLIIGAFVFYFLERNHFLADKTWLEAFFYSLFNSVTTRSGGLATMDVNQLTEPNQLFLSLLMFIGSSPSSTGGGIRTTTLFVVLLVVLTFIRGDDEVRIFRRSLHQDDITKSFVVIIMALLLVFVSVIVLKTIEPFSLTAIVFEICSAFGTCGLSMGITPFLSLSGKILVICLMFIGRIGIINFLYLMSLRKEKRNYHYSKERILIG